MTDEEEYDNDHLSIENEPMPDVSITLPYQTWRRVAFILMDNDENDMVAYAWSKIEHVCDEAYKKECDRINTEYDEWRKEKMDGRL